MSSASTGDAGLAEPQPRYLIGTAGWSYEDWKGTFYPSPPPPRFNALEYYSRHFSLVEVNSSFYAVMPPSNAEKWLGEVQGNADFAFSMKLWKGLTHERPDELPGREVGAIQDMCRVFAEAGRLATLLLQFPWSFRFSPENRSYLARLLDAFEEFPRTVEVRHSGWMREDFLAFLRDRSVGFCNIDQPPLRDCLELTSQATSPLAYLRLHGRNSENWFNDSADVAQRYDYLYSPEEVADLAEVARTLARQAGGVVVTSNNHFRGQAAANSLMLEAALTGQCGRIPSSLAEAYPVLQKLPSRHPIEPTATQPGLFD